jgi:hypothetical protein
MTVSARGRSYVGVADADVAVVVHRWDGVAWTAVGPPAPVSNVVPELVIDAQGQPWIATVVPDPYRLQILRLSGTTWKLVGAPQPPVGPLSRRTAESRSDSSGRTERVPGRRTKNEAP